MTLRGMSEFCMLETPDATHVGGAVFGAIGPGTNAKVQEPSADAVVLRGRPVVVHNKAAYGRSIVV